MTESAEYQPPKPEPSGAASWAHLASLSAAMLERLEECRRERADPPVEAVHRLRTGARRVETTLALLARQAGARGLGVEAEAARTRWRRQLKKVRRAAGAVRDLDVHRELLAENFLPAEPYTAPDTPLMHQARALDAWLEERRRSAAEEMVSVLDRRVTRLLASGERFLAAMAERRPTRPRSMRGASRVALEDYLRMADAMPMLDRENLHDFRKGAKKARYVTESEPDDASAKALGRAIKRAQDAIGTWHDWQVLTEEAREALNSDGDGLIAQLETRTQQEYARALRVTHATSRRLAGEWQALHPRRRSRG